MRAFVLSRTYYQRVRRFTNPIIATVLIVLFVRYFVADTYRIPSDSMQPTLVDGDHVIGIKLVYGIRLPGGAYLRFSDPERADAVVIKRPDGENYIKRVVARAGDIVDIKNGELSVSGHKVEKKFGVDTKRYRYIDPDHSVYSESIDGRGYSVMYSVSKRPDDLKAPVKLTREQLFLLGDNRTNSVDSRDWGAQIYDDVVAKVAFVWFSKDPLSGKIRWDRIGTIEQ